MLRASERACVKNELLDFRLCRGSVGNKLRTDGFRSNNGVSFFLYIRKKETNTQANFSVEPPASPRLP